MRCELCMPLRWGSGVFDCWCVTDIALIDNHWWKYWGRAFKISKSACYCVWKFTHDNIGLIFKLIRRRMKKVFKRYCLAILKLFSFSWPNSLWPRMTVLQRVRIYTLYLQKRAQNDQLNDKLQHNSVHQSDGSSYIQWHSHHSLQHVAYYHENQPLSANRFIIIHPLYPHILRRHSLIWISEQIRHRNSNENGN